ncbi:endocellulase [Mycena maculata]|uniref:Endocellulase n=1 Tax=Mycena maculata TaxID=230809 RepID=A0AAD7NUP8_9AGAR|nr:endocellulase [Mycena maculata]
MYFSALVTLSCLFSLGASQTITIQNDCLPAGGYTLCQNLWNIAAAVGSQNSTLMSSSTETVSWATNYTWADGGDSVKSYANVESLDAKGVQLSNISSAPTSWSWNFETQSSGTQGDVAYDIWFGQASSGRPSTTESSYEIMIWLSAIGGMQPIGSQSTTGIDIAGHTWNLWKGSNENWEVFSFGSAGGDINSFDVDLNAFFTYLVSEQGVAESQYVQVIQAGTEAAVGSATFVTTSYSVSIVPK